MSNKERILQLIDDVPDKKLYFIINILENMKAYANEAVEPDEIDLLMIRQAKKENDGNTITLDEMCNELGIKL